MRSPGHDPRHPHAEDRYYVERDVVVDTSHGKESPEARRKRLIRDGLAASLNSSNAADANPFPQSPNRRAQVWIER